jgi:hypothetical protein
MSRIMARAVGPSKNEAEGRLAPNQAHFHVTVYW